MASSRDRACLKPQPLLQEIFEKGDEKALTKLHEATKRYPNENIVCFDQTLLTDYRQKCADFKKGLEKYLICREIAMRRLGEASEKETEWLLYSIEDEKADVEKKILSLESLEEQIQKANEQKTRASYAAAFPHLSYEDAKEAWLQKDFNPNISR